MGTVTLTLTLTLTLTPFAIWRRLVSTARGSCAGLLEHLEQRVFVYEGSTTGWPTSKTLFEFGQRTAAAAAAGGERPPREASRWIWTRRESCLESRKARALTKCSKPRR